MAGEDTLFIAQLLFSRRKVSLLLAGGAEVVHDVSNFSRMNFAILEAGKDDQNCTIFSFLQQESVLHVGRAVAVDLVARVRANCGLSVSLHFGIRNGIPMDES